MKQLDKVWSRHNRGIFTLFSTILSWFRFDGLYAFLNWVFFPVMRKLVWPFCRFTGLTAIYNVTLGPVLSGIYGLLAKVFTFSIGIFGQIAGLFSYVYLRIASGFAVVADDL
jgi:hypothetical protein